MGYQVHKNCAPRHGQAPADFKAVRPTGCEPYVWATREQAQVAAEQMNDGSMSWDDFKIVHVLNRPNIGTGPKEIAT